MERFATEATEALRRQPQTVEEIGESNKRHSEYKDRMEEMWKLMDRSDKKNKVLAMWTKEQVHHREIIIFIINPNLLVF